MEKVMHFSSGSNGKQAAIVLHIFLHAEFSAMDYTLNIVSKWRFFFIFKHSRAPKRSWEIFCEGPGKSWIFLVSKRVGTLWKMAVKMERETSLASILLTFWTAGISASHVRVDYCPLLTCINWSDTWKNRISSTTMKLRKSLKASDAAEYIELFGSFTWDRHARRI